MAKTQAAQAAPDVRYIPLNKIKVQKGFNSRTEPLDRGGLEELGSNIYQNGQIQPGVVQALATKAEAYVVRVGERRLRAIMLWNENHPGDPPLAFLAIVEPVFKAEGDAEEQKIAKAEQLKDALLVNLSENLVRKDLSVFEKADRLNRLHVEHGMSVKDLATRTGKDRSTIEMYLKVADTEKLPAPIRTKLQGASVGLSTAAMIADVKSPEDPEDVDKNKELQEKLISECETTGAITREKVAKAKRVMADEGKAATASRVKAVGIVELRGDIQQMLESYTPDDDAEGGVSHAQALFFALLKRYIEGRLKFETFCDRLDKMLMEQAPPKKKKAKVKKVKAEVEVDAEAGE
jgi:ParB-like chromosome segregation protein Spo0J